jgi:hypothetical protein
MDTIVYIYRKRGLEAPGVEPVGLKKYLLIRIELDADADTWFGERLGMPEVPQMQDYLEAMPTDSGEGSFAGEQFGFLEKIRRILGLSVDKGQEGQPEKAAGAAGRRRRKGRLNQTEEDNQVVRIEGEAPEFTGQKRRKGGEGRSIKRLERNCQRKAQTEREALLQEREERLRRTEAAIRKLAREVQELAQLDSASGISRTFMGEDAPGQNEPKREDIFCVYEDGIGKALSGQKVLAGLWQKWFAWRTFEGFTDFFWAEQLMDAARWPQFVILGTSDCIPKLIEAYAPRMKSLRWILPEAGFTEEVQVFAEDFYVESGLAIALQTIPETGAFRRMQLISALPANILDFTGETHVLTAGLAQGSVWMDMRSLEEKKRRILGRGDGITYVSLKEKWKYAQRRCKNPVLS